MPVAGTLLIAGREVVGEGRAFNGVEAATGCLLEPQFKSASVSQLSEVCGRADEAFDSFASTTPVKRAELLEAIGEEIVAIGDELIERAMAETALLRMRLENERMRTVNQLRAFAAFLREGDFASVRIDRADPGRRPPKPDLRLVKRALGPVAVFGASNFPLAFSVAGGDTASALAAGCPVVVKAHSAHPGVSHLVGQALSRAVEACDLDGGVFSLVFDEGFDIGRALVGDPRIKAVGFTGSRRGGLALMDVAMRRPEPIPVYAEMSSTNPVLLMPGRLEAAAEEIAKDFIAALTLGVGQFCTNPGLVLAIADRFLDRFVETAAVELKSAPAAPMLTAGIFDSYCAGVERLSKHDAVRLVGVGGDGQRCGQPCLFETEAASFLADQSLSDEVFGASSLLVRCQSIEEMHSVLCSIEGQLTISVHMNETDHPTVEGLMPLIERKAGRIIANGFGTGVEVSPAMVHGGPYPSTSDGRSTSVGTLAIERFLRPVCYQDMPENLVSPAVRDENPWNLVRTKI